MKTLNHKNAHGKNLSTPLPSLNLPVILAVKKQEWVVMSLLRIPLATTAKSITAEIESTTYN